MSDLYAISISGSYGKRCTLMYINFFLNNVYKKNNILLDIADNKIKKYKINDKEFVKFENSESIENDIIILKEILSRNQIEIILTISSKLDNFFNLILTAITSIDYLYKEIRESEYFLRENIPFMISVNKKEVMEAVKDICMEHKAPVLLSEHHHLAYINQDIGTDARYNYSNFALALRLAKLTSMMLQENTYTPLDLKIFKTTTFNNVIFYEVPYPKELPPIKNIDLGDYYFKTFTKNKTTFYLESCVSVKASNYLHDWFCKKVEKKTNIQKYLIYYGEPTGNLLEILTPLSVIDFKTIFVIDYGEVGFSIDDIIKMFYIRNKVATGQDYWSETICKTFGWIFNNSIYQNLRKRNYEVKSGFVAPDIICDKVKFVARWLEKVSIAHPNDEIHVLCCGSKIVIDELLLKIKN